MPALLQTPACAVTPQAVRLGTAVYPLRQLVSVEPGCVERSPVMAYMVGAIGAVAIVGSLVMGYFATIMVATVLGGTLIAYAVRDWRRRGPSYLCEFRFVDGRVVQVAGTEAGVRELHAATIEAIDRQA